MTLLLLALASQIQTYPIDAHRSLHTQWRPEFMAHRLYVVGKNGSRGKPEFFPCDRDVRFQVVRVGDRRYVIASGSVRVVHVSIYVADRLRLTEVASDGSMNGFELSRTGNSIRLFIKRPPWDYGLDANVDIVVADAYELHPTKVAEIGVWSRPSGQNKKWERWY